MKKDIENQENLFVDFSSFRHISATSESTRSSVIKSERVNNTGVARIEVLDGGKAEPTILIHRQGEQISKIEFTCSCGKSTHLDLEYDEE